MIKELISQPEFKLIGLTARTNNKNEKNPDTAKISQLMSQYWGKNLASQIPNRTNPGVTFSVYTDYEANEHGDYTYFLGEQVSSFENITSSMQRLIIPAAKYQKFTTTSGKMPEVVINAWQEIWKMSVNDFGGERAYSADFEVYDQRASDPANASLDIYIGIK